MQQRIPHPTSRLSPPPGLSVPELLSSAGASSSIADASKLVYEDGQGTDRQGGLGGDGIATGSGGRRRDEAPKRGYRACVHCRLRKAKCDLGDVNSPKEPPCTRCRREQRNCVFLPSKRRKKNRGDDDEEAIQADSSFASVQQEWTLPTQENRYQSWQSSMPPSAFQDGSSSSSGIFAYPDLPQRPSETNMNNRPNDLYRALSGYQTTTPSQINNISPTVAVTGPTDPPSLTNTTPDSTSTSALSPNQQNHRPSKRHKGPDATRRIVVANFSNETDALEILANAATDEDKGHAGNASGKGGKHVAWKDTDTQQDFLLLRLGILDMSTLLELIQVYFKYYHPFLPVFQTNRIPKSIPSLKLLASEDPFLISCLVIVASRHHNDPRMRSIHEQTWALIRDAIADACFGGAETSVGLVEGVLILAEFLPREKVKGGGSRESLELLSGKGESGLHGIENRRGWNLTGIAIRAAYGLGLDQIAMDLAGERTPEFERARLAFTWCYLYDRTIDKSTLLGLETELTKSRLRTGLAFWSRGPAICFTGYSHVTQTGESAARANFPSMISPGETGDTKPRPNTVQTGSGTDSASFIQALMELTQIMTNAHDTLYPNRDRTNDLVRQGAYFRFLDSFRKALDSFKSVWSPKIWNDDNLKELTWCTFEMVRLYISSFAFQAHVQRAWFRAEEEGGNPGGAGGASAPSGGVTAGMGLSSATAPLLSMAGQAGGVQLFPRGSATSPDALYIYASVDAAAEILSICLRLSHKGVLRYLPSRYLINFVFGGVFALKAAYSGAQGRGDLAKTRELVDRVCAALVLASPDRDHPASRYGQMLRLLSKKLEELSEQSAVPSRFPSPEPATNPESSMNTAWEQFMLPDLSAHTGADVSANGNGMANIDPILTNAGPTDPGGASTGLEGLFDFDVDVNFNMDGFWDDFTLAEGSGFPFR